MCVEWAVFGLTGGCCYAVAMHLSGLCLQCVKVTLPLQLTQQFKCLIGSGTIRVLNFHRSMRPKSVFPTFL